MRQKALPKPLEGEVKKAIVDYFALVYHIELHRRNTGAMAGSHAGKRWYVKFSAPGQADLWGILPKTGRHIEIECKREGEIPSDIQSAWLASCRGKGAIAFWADSIDMAIAKYEEQRDFR